MKEKWHIVIYAYFMFQMHLFYLALFVVVFLLGGAAESRQKVTLIGPVEALQVERTASAQERNPASSERGRLVQGLTKRRPDVSGLSLLASVFSPYSYDRRSPFLFPSLAVSNDPVVSRYQILHVYRC